MLRHLLNCPMNFKKHQVAIFEPRVLKDKFAIVAFSVTDQHNGIGIDDPTTQPSRRFFSYETEAQALNIFHEILAATVENGSILVYSGPQNNG